MDNSGRKPTRAEVERERVAREQAAHDAMNCPCLDKLKSGICGQEFSKAFLCFLKSGHPDKGSDCVDPEFVNLQKCVEANHDAILRSEPQDDKRRHKEEADLPEVPVGKILLPPFLKKK